ncbi:hypothetical protein GQ43DRAFT_475791 [Delitschia confertaspora ATCC 74209]|uniref:Uncharacterized protein n=1 Tax=Delitschia confertaspora ATCC 74209 TaxID=1513339 RepID=A0A9P4MNF3_9PLEO|nr:hypothetical protein GQ43DRAFT_475791 [Delitschia confertaspora ATCC 74209]
MADDKRVIALTKAVATNVDRLRQSINSLRQLHDRWNDGHGTFINLIAQLTALKSNLSEMQDWMNYSISDLHPQLLQDLDVLMTSCGMLVRNLDALAVQLRRPDHDHVDWAIKLRFVVSRRCMNQLRDVARRQADAVNLLLAACKCHHTAQRKILLHKSRQIRKEDASSLATLLKGNPRRSRTIDFLTQLSKMIQWCRVLFYAKLKGVAHEPPTQQVYLDAAAAMRSEAIDRQIEEDATSSRRETKVVLLGDTSGGKDLIMRQMQVLFGEGYSQEEHVKHRMAIRSVVRVLMHAIISLLKDTGVALSEELNRDFAVLLQEVDTINQDSISPQAVQAVENIWNSKQFSTIYLKNFEIDFPPYAPYFAAELSRISSSDYIPTSADIIRLSIPSNGIKELRFSWDPLSIHLFSLCGFIPTHFWKHWLHQIDGCSTLLYTVDVSTYDLPLDGSVKESQLEQVLVLFQSAVNAKVFEGSSVVLLFNNFSRFKEKLAHSPLSAFFPDYREDLHDPTTSARKYILSRFKDVIRHNMSIYSFWVDLDMSDNQHLYAALKKTLLHIQQHKARSEVWEKGTGTTSPSSLGRSETVTTVRSSKFSKG